MFVLQHNIAACAFTLPWRVNALREPALISDSDFKQPALMREFSGSKRT
jgi:hypothetical protein